MSFIYRELERYQFHEFVLLPCPLKGLRSYEIFVSLNKIPYHKEHNFNGLSKLSLSSAWGKQFCGYIIYYIRPSGRRFPFPSLLQRTKSWVLEINAIYIPIQIIIINTIIVIVKQDQWRHQCYIHTSWKLTLQPPHQKKKKQSLHKTWKQELWYLILNTDHFTLHVSVVFPFSDGIIQVLKLTHWCNCICYKIKGIRRL